MKGFGLTKPWPQYEFERPAAHVPAPVGLWVNETLAQCGFERPAAHVPAPVSFGARRWRASVTRGFDADAR